MTWISSTLRGLHKILGAILAYWYKNNMSGEHDSHIVEIQRAEQEITSDSESDEEPEILNNSWMSSISKERITFKGLGVTSDEQLLDEVKKAEQLLDEQRAEENVRNSQEVKIHKAPKIMARKEENLEEYYKPRELSIGPIHAAGPSLFKKELKLKLAAHFFIETRKTADELLGRCKARFAGIRTHFNKGIIMSSTTDAELIWLMFLDGCAMLGFINSYMWRGLEKFDISYGQAELIRQDLFLMENQIPFTVLDALMGYTKRRVYEYYILLFIQENSIIPKDLLELILDHRESLFCYCNGTKQPDHILGLYRRILLTKPRDSHNCFHTFLSFFGSTFGCVFSLLVVLISFVRIKCFDEATEDPNRREIRRMIGITHSFRNIQELKTAGISLKPTYSLRRLFFHSGFITGQLSIPSLVVDDSTERMMLNLVAYEMCLNKKQATESIFTLIYNALLATIDDVDTDNQQQATNSQADAENDSWVTSYVKLLDVVIDNEQDVKDLRAAGIIQNHLSSDNEVAQLINRMGSNCFAPSKDTYEHVKEKIEKHYRRRCAIWMAQVCHSHFSTPWTILALFAATAVLGLTTVQTYYAVNP